MASLNARNRLMKPFVANSKIVFTLPLGGKIRRGTLVLQGQIVVSGVTTSGTVVGEGGPVNLAQRVYVVATPSGGSRYPGGKIVDVDPRSLLRFAVRQRSGKFFADQGGSTLGGGANGTYPIYLAIPIYWADPTQTNPIGSGLNTDIDPGTGLPVYASVQVELDTGSLASCFTGNNGVVDYTGLTVQWVDDRVAVTGDTAIVYQESHQALIAATNKRMLDEAMPQDGNFLSWDIFAEQGAAKTLSDGLLNRIVVSGPTLDFDKYAQDIRQTALDDEWYDPSLTATGMYPIDFTDGANLANSVPASGLQIYFDVNNVSGSNLDDLLFFTRRAFVPAPAPSKSGN